MQMIIPIVFWGLVVYLWHIAVSAKRLARNAEERVSINEDLLDKVLTELDRCRDELRETREIIWKDDE